MRNAVCFCLILFPFAVWPDTPPSPKQTASVTAAETAEALPAVLDLDTALRRAIADNPSLKAAEARVKQSRQRLHQVWSTYLPQVDASYSLSRTWLPDRTIEDARNAALGTGLSSVSQTSASILVDPTAYGLASRVVTSGQTLLGSIQASRAIQDTVDSYGFSLVARWVLFDGLSREFGHAAAHFGLKETKEAQREARRLILSAVAQSYYGVQLARENLQIARADEAYNARLLKDAQARQRVGAGSLSDVLNFEVQVRAAQAQMLSAQQAYHGARISLAALMGIPDAQLPEDSQVAELAVEAPEEMSPPEEAELAAYALDQRPDLGRNELAVKRTKAVERQQYAAFLPHVSAFASRDVQTNDNSSFHEDEFSSTVGISVSQSIFAGGRNVARLAEARQARREAEYTLDSAEIDVLSQVRNALIDLATAQESLVLQRDTAQYVEKNRDLVEKEYNAGQGSLTRLTQAQRDLITAQGRLALARVSLRQAWFQLRTSTAASLEGFENDLRE